MWKLKPLFPSGPSSQPGPADRGSQTSTRSSASSSNCTICSWLTWCYTLATRPDGPDGNHCSRCGCSLYCGTHPGSCHHWGFSGGGNAAPANPDITHQEPQGTQLLGQQSDGPCSLESIQNQSDVKLGENFNKVLWQYRIAHGVSTGL